MSDHSKEAPAAGKAATDESLTSLASAEGLSRGWSSAKDQSLLQQAIWCGTVFALAVVFVSLNLMPPVPVGYCVSTQVIASPQRLETLRQRMHDAAHSCKAEASDDPELIGLQLLDDHSRSLLGQKVHETLALVEVRSLWPTRTSSGKVNRWLSELTQTDERTISQFDTASQERFARWEVEAREHYLRHFRYLHGHVDGDPANSGIGKLVGTSDRLPTRFASLSASPLDKATGKSGTDIETELMHDLEAAQTNVLRTSTELQDQASEAAGTLTLTGENRVRAQPGKVPSYLVFSVLVLAIASGAIGGWAHHRVQSGGLYAACEVAKSLDQLGIPIMGCLDARYGVPNARAYSFQRRLLAFGGRIVKHGTTCSELLLLFWCLAIVMRLVLDPLWRAMLWESPLAAFGRLFVGLP